MVRTKRLMATLCVAAFLVGGSLGALAAPEYEVGISANANGGTPVQRTQQGATAVQDSATVPGIQASATVTASATPGIVSAAVHAVADTQTGSSTTSAGANGQSRFVIDDVIFTGPDVKVTTSLNLLLSADMETMLANCDLKVSGQVAQINPDGTVAMQFDFNGEYRRNANGILWAKNGFLDPLPDRNPLNAFLILTTDSFEVPTNVELRVTLRTECHASVNLVGRGLGEGTLNSTLCFSPLGPVFNLPAGFSVDSPQGRIVGNRVPAIGSPWTLNFPQPNSSWGLFGNERFVSADGTCSWESVTGQSSFLALVIGPIDCDDQVPRFGIAVSLGGSLNGVMLQLSGPPIRHVSGQRQ